MDAIVANGAKMADVEESLKCTLEMDTSSASPAEQFDLFRSWHEDVVELEPAHERFPSFRAHEMAWNLGTITALRLEVPGQGSRYLWRHIRRAAVDNWYLFLPLSKDQNSGEEQKVGKPIMESFANPFEYVTEDDAFVALFIPRNLSFMQSSRVEIRHESNLLLADYLLLLNRSLHSLRGTDVPYIVAATMSLLTACFTLSRDDTVNAQNVIDTVIFERASKVIAQRLSAPDLTPDRLCRELGVSRSRLYRIFEPIGGVSSYIRRKRLLKTHEILVDSSDGRPISTIAAEWGFTDPSTYSRMFRKEFGITPKEARVEGWRGRRHTSWQQNGLPDDRAHTLSMLLLRNSFGL